MMQLNKILIQNLNLIEINFVFILIYCLSSSQTLRYGCPAKAFIKSCLCSEKNKGLYVKCENATLVQLQEDLESLNQINQIIYYLRIFHNLNLKILPVYLLDGFQILNLALNLNNLTLIESNSFLSLKDHLISLDLSSNRLQKVPSSALSVLSSLISLNLNFNQIQILENYAFSGLVSLLQLSLYGNQIKQIDANAFHDVGGNLTRINLGSNQLTHFPSKFLSQLQTLNRLHLHENQINKLEADAFVDFITSDSLDTLVLSSNRLRIIPNRAFKYLVSLNLLELSNNQINLIEPFAFNQMEKSLEWLKLADNNLNEIPSDSLRNLSKLRLLDVRSNNISKIYRDTFRTFGSSLKFLHLQNNKISFIEDGSFDELNSLEWLYLSSNKLYTVSQRLFNPILNLLKILDLHDNPFICDCELIWLHDWTLDKGLSVLNLPKKTFCFKQSNNNSKTKLNLIKQYSSSNLESKINNYILYSKYKIKLNEMDSNSNQENHNLSELETNKENLNSPLSNTKKEVLLTNIERCSNTSDFNYKYHIYCLILSFIVVHIINYFLLNLF